MNRLIHGLIVLMALSLIACEDKRLIKAPKPFIDPLPQDIKGGRRRRSPL